MTNKFILAAAGGVSVDPVSTNLLVHYDYGDTNCWNRLDPNTYGGNQDDIIDLTGNGYNAKLHNATTTDYEYKSSKGGYIRLIETNTNKKNITAPSDGGSSGGSFPQAIGTGAFTMEWVSDQYFATGELVYTPSGQDWVYSNSNLLYWSAGLNETPRILGFHWENTSGTTWALEELNLNDTNTYVNQSNTTANLITDSSSNYISYTGNTGWQHWSLTRDSFTSSTTNNLKLYINGVLRYTTTNRNDLNAPNYGMFGIWDKRQITIASIGNHGLFKVYSAALTATEVTQNYNAYKPRFGL